MMEFEGSNHLRSRLVLSTLSGKPIRIRKIRYKDDNPGLKEYEASLIRLFDKLTNGSKFEVSETGTSLYYQPGLLIGGKLQHDCSLERGIGYFMEPLIQLGLFCKNPIQIILKGVTNNQIDPSPDLLRYSSINVLKKFLLIDEGLEIKVLKRGAAPGGGGQVLMRIPIRKNLRPLQLMEQGKIKRIRGVAWATRVSPAVTNRVVEAAKSILLKFIPDVYIHTDHLTGKNSGQSPGFGLILIAETTNGNIFSSEITSNPSSTEKKTDPTVPEDLAVEGAHLLLEEIFRGGCVDSSHQSLALLLMALGKKDVSKIVVGPLSDFSIYFLRLLRDFFQITFKLETYKNEDDQNDGEPLKLGADKVLLSCVGDGFTNLAKRTT